MGLPIVRSSLLLETGEQSAQVQLLVLECIGIHQRDDDRADSSDCTAVHTVEETVGPDS